MNQDQENADHDGAGDACDEYDDIPQEEPESMDDIFVDPSTNYAYASFPDGGAYAIGLINGDWTLSLLDGRLINRSDLQGLEIIWNGIPVLINRSDIINRDDIVICNRDCIKDRYQLINRSDFSGIYPTPIVEDIVNAYLLPNQVVLDLIIPFSIADAEAQPEGDMQKPVAPPAPSPRPEDNPPDEEETIANYVDYGCIVTQLQRNAELDSDIVFNKAIVINRTERQCNNRLVITHVAGFIVAIVMAVQVPEDRELPRWLEPYRGKIFIDRPAVFACRDKKIPLYRIDPDPNFRFADPFVRTGGVYETSRGGESRLEQFDCTEASDPHDRDGDYLVDVLKDLEPLSKLREELHNNKENERRE